MTKENLIQAIVQESKIHHNITTLGMKLPEAPKGMPADMFWMVCSDIVSMFSEKWENDKRSDSGNRNLCACRKDNPGNIRADGACKKHDIYHLYQAGRTGATLYWEKYWRERNMQGVHFKYDEEELEEKEAGELKEMLDDMQEYNNAVADMLKTLPDELKYRYEEWEESDKEAKRREAMGYNKTLGELLESENPAILRLAKGIKKELVK